MKKVISMALFGARNRYAQYLPANVRAFSSVFSADWTLRIHHDESIFDGYYGDVLHGLEALGQLELRYMGRTPELCAGMLWRLAPAFDEDVDTIFCRDLDALLTHRDRTCMETFLASDATLHTVHDHPMHDGVMGGLSGFRAAAFKDATGFRSVADLLAAARPLGLSRHGADQDFLNKVVAPRMRAFVHHVPRRSTAAAISEPTPPPTTEVDELAPHLGSAGFDVQVAVEFFDVQSTAETSLVRVAESEAGFGTGSSRRVVLSSDANGDYSFYAPLTCAMWRTWGFRPTLLLVGEAEQWLDDARLRLALKASRRAGAEIHFLGDFDGHRTSTVAQVARLFGANAPGVDASDFVLTSDVDMWPLGPWIGAAEANPNQDVVKLFYANAYGSDPLYPAKLHFPMCYVGAAARTWREILGSLEPRIATTIALEDCRTWLVNYRAAHPNVNIIEKDWAWNYDEALLGLRLFQWDGWPDRCECINRTFGVGEQRLDRSDWRLPASSSLYEFADSHLLRPGDGAHWENVRPLIAMRAERVDGFGWLVEWADSYRAQWQRATEGR